MSIFIIPAVSMHQLHFAVNATTPEEALIKLKNNLNNKEEYAQTHMGIFVNIDESTPLESVTEEQYKKDFYNKNPYLIGSDFEPLSVIVSE
jgi:hypothetical protein